MNSQNHNSPPYSTKPQYHSTDRFTPMGFSSPIQTQQRDYKGNFHRGNRQNQNYHRNKYHQNASGWQNRNNKQVHAKKEESIIHFYHPSMLENPWKILIDKSKSSGELNDKAESSFDTSSKSVGGASCSSSDSDNA